MHITAELKAYRFSCYLLQQEEKDSKIWKRSVDDTFVIQHHIHIEGFLEHINSVDPSIQFIVGETSSNGFMPFLDTTVAPQTDGTFTTGIYRKPTHTLTYIIHWDSHRIQYLNEV